MDSAVVVQQGHEVLVGAGAVIQDALPGDVGGRAGNGDLQEHEDGELVSGARLIQRNPLLHMDVPAWLRLGKARTPCRMANYHTPFQCPPWCPRYRPSPCRTRLQSLGLETPG